MKARSLAACLDDIQREDDRFETAYAAAEQHIQNSRDILAQYWRERAAMTLGAEA